MFHDSYLQGTSMMGDTSLTSVAKASIEKKVSFSDLLKKEVTAADIALYLNKKSV